MDSALMSLRMFQLGNLLFLSGGDGVGDGSCHGVDGGWTLELSLWQCQGLDFLSDLFQEHLLFHVKVLLYPCHDGVLVSWCMGCLGPALNLLG